MYRPPDHAQSFNKSSDLRFSPKSPCDYIMFNGNYLFFLELKSVAKKSISFERNEKEKGVIHFHQIESLKKFSHFKNVIAGLLIDFRGTGNTWFLSITEWDGLINSVTKKSFTENDLLSYSHPLLISKKKLKINYRYDVDQFINDSVKYI